MNKKNLALGPLFRITVITVSYIYIPQRKKMFILTLGGPFIMRLVHDLLQSNMIRTLFVLMRTKIYGRALEPEGKFLFFVLATFFLEKVVISILLSRNLTFITRNFDVFTRNIEFNTKS